MVEIVAELKRNIAADEQVEIRVKPPLGEAVVLTVHIPSDLVMVDYSAIPSDKSGGTLTAAGFPSGEAIARGAEIVFAAVPAEGHRVAGWNNANCATGAVNEAVSCSLTANDALNVTVTFAFVPPAVFYGKEFQTAGDSAELAEVDHALDGPARLELLGVRRQLTLMMISTTDGDDLIAAAGNDPARFLDIRNFCSDGGKGWRLPKLSEAAGLIDRQTRDAVLLGRNSSFVFAPGMGLPQFNSVLISYGALSKGDYSGFSTEDDGILADFMVRSNDAFRLAVARIRRGKEPPQPVVTSTSANRRMICVRESEGYSAPDDPAGIQVNGMTVNSSGTLTVTLFAPVNWVEGDDYGLLTLEAWRFDDDGQTVLANDNPLSYLADSAAMNEIEKTEGFVIVGLRPNSGNSAADLSVFPRTGRTITVKVQFVRLAAQRTISYSHLPQDGGGGTLTASVETGGTAAERTEVDFTATPAAGYYVSVWEGDGGFCALGGGSAIGPTDGVISCGIPVGAEDLTVRVLFARALTVRYNPSPAGGALSADVGDGEGVARGAAVIFRAAPQAGYYVRGWRGDGGVCSSGAPESAGPVDCALTAADDEGLNPTVVFAPAFATVHFSQPENGAISARRTDTSADIASGGIAPDLVSVEFSADPDSGWYVAEWTDDCQASGATVADENAEAEDGVAKLCALPMDTLANVSITVGAVFARVRRALNPDKVVAERAPEYRAADGYFGPGHRIEVGAGYGLESESYDSSALSYDVPSRVIGILDSNRVVAGATLRLAVTAAAVCTGPDDFCLPLDLTVTASFVPVAAPEQSVLRARENDAFDPHPLALPTGFDGPTVTLAGVDGGEGVFRLDENGRVAAVSVGGAARGTYEITAHMTHGEMLGTLALVVTAEILSQSTVYFTQIPADGRGGSLEAEALDSGAALTSRAEADGNSIVRFRSRARTEWHVTAWTGDAACAPGEARLAGAVQNCDVLIIGSDIYVTVFFGRDECYHANPCAAGEVCTDSNLLEDGGTSCLAHYSVDYGVSGRNSVGGVLVESGGGDLTAFVNGAPLDSGGRAPSGAMVTFTATPEANYYASAWSGCDSAARVEIGDDDDGGAKDCVKTADADLGVTVSFARRMRDVSIALAENGDILGGISGGESFLEGGAPDREYQVAQGLEAIFTARPSPGYYVSAWGGDCAADRFNGAVGSADEGGDAPYESAVSRDCVGTADRDLQVSAVFAKIPLDSFTVTFFASEGGTVLAEMTEANYVGALATLSVGGLAEHGAWLRFTAAPEDDYRFEKWTDACDGKDILGCRLRATMNATVGAVFVYNRNECQYYEPPTGDPIVNGGCAPVSAGGVCVDPDLATRNDRQCSCATGHAGDGVGANGCRAERTVNFEESPGNGNVYAATGGVNLADSAIVADGARVTFTAEPADGYYVSAWTHDCATEPAGDPGSFLLPDYDSFDDVRECVRIAAGGNLRAGAVFARLYYSECALNPFGAQPHSCAPGEVCRDPSVSTEGDAVCDCPEGSARENGACAVLPSVAFDQPENGRIYAVYGDSAEAARSLESVPFGAVVTFIAVPNEGYTVHAWTDDCDGTAIDNDQSEQKCVLTAGDSTSPGSLSVGAKISLIPPSSAASLPEGVAESGDVDLSGAVCAALGGTAFSDSDHDDFATSVKGCRDSAGTECLYERGGSADANCQPLFNRLRDCMLRAESGQSVPRGFLCDAANPTAAAPAAATGDESAETCRALGGAYTADGEFSSCENYGAATCYLSLCAPLFDAARTCNAAGQIAVNGTCGASCDPLTAAGGRCVALIFSQPENGTLSAVRSGLNVHPVADVARGDVLIFTAAPDANYYVSAWTGDCADIGAKGAPVEGAVEKTCSLTADDDPQVGVAFAEIVQLDECQTSNPCHAEAACADPDMFTSGSALTCTCNEGYGGDGTTCERLLVTLTFAPEGNGRVSVFAESGVSVASGGTVLLGERVTFAAIPDANHYVSAWSGHCADAGQTGDANDADSFRRNCVLSADENLAATAVFAPRRVNECAEQSPCGARGLCTDPDPLSLGSALECACDVGHAQSAPDQPCKAL